MDFWGLSKRKFRKNFSFSSLANHNCLLFLFHVEQKTDIRKNWKSDDKFSGMLSAAKQQIGIPGISVRRSSRAGANLPEIARDAFRIGVWKGASSPFSRAPAPRKSGCFSGSLLARKRERIYPKEASESFKMPFA